ncbi:MAG: hypothetical protein AB1633_10115 [Elusimicrobiota bacterium]
MVRKNFSKIEDVFKTNRDSIIESEKLNIASGANSSFNVKTVDYKNPDFDNFSDQDKITINSLFRIVKKYGQMRSLPKIKRDVLSLNIDFISDNRDNTMEKVYHLVKECYNYSKYKQINIKAFYKEGEIGIQTYFVEDKFPLYQEWLEEIIIY